MENDSIAGFLLHDGFLHAHVHTYTLIFTHTHSDWVSQREKKRKNELLIMPSNYGVWPWERYDPGEITSNSHLSQQIEWKTLVRGEERREETREKKRGQEKSGDKRPPLCYQTLLLKYAKEMQGSREEG